MVNRENVLRVADAIENHSIKWLGFNMDVYVGAATASIPDRLDSCGTVACIAGWVQAVLGPVDTEDDLYDWRLKSRPTANAARLLELGLSDAFNLTQPSIDGSRWSKITPRQAVAVLRHLAETGKVDWSVAPAPTKPEETP